MSELAGKEGEYMDNRVTLRQAIDTQLGLIGLAQMTQREDLLESSLERMNTLLKQIPGDLFVKD